MTAQKENRLAKKKQKWNEAYVRATTNLSMSNFTTVIAGFIAKGIPENEILPKVNVLTYDAWKSVGRYVKKGEHGVHIPVVAHGETKVCDAEYDENEMEIKPAEKKSYRILGGTTVFHISQTAEMTKGGKF